MLLVRTGGAFGVFVALIVAGIFLFVVRPAINDTTDRAFETADRALDQASQQTADLRESIDQPGDVAGADYLSAESFRALVADIRAEIGGDAELLGFTVSEHGGDVKYRTGDRAAGFSWSAGREGLQPLEVTLVGPGKLEDNVFPIAKLRADAAPRLAAAVAKQAGADLEVHSMTLGMSPVTGAVRWTIAGAGDGRARTFSAKPDGTGLERLG